MEQHGGGLAMMQDSSAHSGGGAAMDRTVSAATLLREGGPKSHVPVDGNAVSQHCGYPHQVRVICATRLTLVPLGATR